MGSGASQQNNYFKFEQYKDYEEECFLNYEVERVELRKRKLKIFFEHSDVYFYTNNECLIVCFHQGKSRVALIRQTEAYSQQCLHIYEKRIALVVPRTITIFNVLQNVLPITKQKYNILINNCNDNSAELIKNLKLT